MSEIPHNSVTGFTKTDKHGTFYAIDGRNVDEIRSTTTTAVNTLVLVHGIGSFSGCFDQLVQQLTPLGYNILRYDLIGRGKSDNHASEKFGADAHVDQLLDLLDHLQISAPIHLAGHSMGGAIAALFTAQYPSRVASLTLLSSAGLMDGTVLAMGRCLCCLHGSIRSSLHDPKEQEKVWRKDIFNHKGESLERENQMVQRLQEVYSLHGDRMFEAFWQSVLQFPLYGLQKKLRSLKQIPHLRVLLIWAEQDTTIPMKPNLQRWLDLLKGGSCQAVEHAVISEAAHGFIIEHPERTAEEIHRFLHRYNV